MHINIKIERQKLVGMLNYIPYKLHAAVAFGENAALGFKKKHQLAVRKVYAVFLC